MLQHCVSYWNVYILDSICCKYSVITFFSYPVVCIHRFYHLFSISLSEKGPERRVYSAQDMKKNVTIELNEVPLGTTVAVLCRS